jgi:DNA anti-recombination protein RmuC
MVILKNIVEPVMDNTEKIINQINAIQAQIDKKFLSMEEVFEDLNKKINLILNKVQEFEIVLDAAEIIEEHIEDQESQAKDIFNTDWTPYNDEDFQSEDYENYDDDSEDE